MRSIATTNTFFGNAEPSICSITSCSISGMDGDYLAYDSATKTVNAK